jgi:UDP-N-acetyl-D-mannosaminuronate dehydrogenase
MSRLGEPDAISICVPTPLSKMKDPDVSFIVAATEAVKRSLRRGQAIILESTTYPGTTREILLPALESTGLKVGEDFFLAFSPERVDPGNAVWQTHNTPKVVGVAYKRDIDDIRESPALDILRLLEGQGARVSYHDPHVPCFAEDGHEYRSVPLTPESVRGADCVMIVTDHSTLDYEMIKRNAKLVVDTRNAIPKEA